MSGSPSHGHGIPTTTHWRNPRTPLWYASMFALKQALDMFGFIGIQLTGCDREIKQQLQSLQLHDGEPAKGKKRGRTRRRNLICAHSCSGCAG